MPHDSTQAGSGAWSGCSGSARAHSPLAQVKAANGRIIPGSMGLKAPYRSPTPHEKAARDIDVHSSDFLNFLDDKATVWFQVFLSLSDISRV